MYTPKLSLIAERGLYACDGHAANVVLCEHPAVVSSPRHSTEYQQGWIPRSSTEAT